MGMQSRRMLGLGSWNVTSLFRGKSNYKDNRGHRPYLEGLESRVMLSSDPLLSTAAFAVSKPVLPQVSIAAINTTIEEGQGASSVTTVTISRDSATTAQTVYFKVTGTAKRGTDYVIKNAGGLVFTGSYVTLKAGVSSATLTIETKDDLIGEGAEYATITLSTSSTYGIVAGSSSITSTINDNEPMVAIGGTTGTATGFGGGVKVVRSLSGDINNDGKVDIINVVEREDLGSGKYSDNIQILFNNKSGYGTFNVVGSYETTGIDLHDLKLIDVNGDRKLDLVAMSTTTSAGQMVMYVDVFLNDGKGGFGEPTVYLPVLGPSFTSIIENMTVADISGDGRMDIVVGGSTVDDAGNRQVLNLYGFKGLAGGKFSAPAVYEVNASASKADWVTGQQITAKDINGDRKLDLQVVSATAAAATTVSVLMNTGTNLAPAVKYALADASYKSPLVEDVTGDGKADLVGYFFTGLDMTARIVVYANNGSGVFSTTGTTVATIYAPSTTDMDLMAADLNGDKKLDLIFTDSILGGSDKLYVLLNKGTGTFDDPVLYQLAASVNDVAVADLNGDGKLDIVVATTNSAGPTPVVYTQVLMNQGDGTFNTIFYHDDSVGSSAATLMLADVNGDKKLDVLLSGNYSGGAAHVLINNGDGSFAFQFATKEVAASDTASPIVFQITRSGGDTTNALTVNFGVTGTARRGVDYKLVYAADSTVITGNTITIAAGAASVAVKLVPLTDALAENSETVQLLLKTGTGYQLNPIEKGVAAVIQDFAPVLSIVAEDNSATETVGNSPDTGTFVITADNKPATSPLSVNFVISGNAVRGKDYVLQVNGSDLTGNTVLIPMGDTSVTVTVVPITDDVIEEDKYVIMSIANSASAWTLNPSAASAKVAIHNLQVPVITVAATTPTALESNAAKPGVITFTRTGGDVSQTLDVAYTITGSATNGTDYETLSGTVSFAAGAKTATVLVTPKDDTTTQGAQTVTLTLAASVADSYKVTGVAASKAATVTIKENAYAPAAIDNASVNVTTYVETDVTTKVSHSGAVKFYMANGGFFMVSSSEVVNGSCKYVQTGSTTGKLTLRENNGHTRETYLTFTGATATTATATFTGEVYDATDTLIKTIRGNLSIAISTTNYAPKSLNGVTVVATTTRSSDRTDVGSSSTMVFSATNATQTNKSGSQVVAYTYSAETDSFGLLKFTDEGSEILIQFVTPKTAYYWSCNNKEGFWEMGTIKVTSVVSPT